MNRPAEAAVSPARDLLAVIVVAAAAALAYATTAGEYFVRDDFGVVQLLASKPAGHFPHWFTSSWMEGIWGYVPDEIRPFPALSYQLTALGGAGSPVAHHLLNIAFHAANGALVFALGRRIAGLSWRTAAWAAVVFVLLPVGAESVAWITGRVDSLPAFFYFATLLAYARWRRTHTAAWYGAALLLFFVALFSKQNAITMVATLGAFDLLLSPFVETSATRTSEHERPDAPAVPHWSRARSWLWPLVPFVLMTAGYLWLRYLLFGEALRERILTSQRISDFLTGILAHLAHVVAGDRSAIDLAPVLAIGLLAGAWLAAGRLTDQKRRWQARAALVYFGPVWWFVGIAPTLVAGYESPRHAYLAAAGWPIALGVAADLGLTFTAGRLGRRVVTVTAVLVAAAYAALLQRELRTWHVAASVSRQAASDLQAQAPTLPPNTLVFVSAPVRSWEWALPFVARPPFASEDLTARVLIVSPNHLSCCRSQWFEETRSTLRRWQGHPDAAVVALWWHPETGALSQVTGVEEPALRAMVPLLLEAQSQEELDATLERMMLFLVADREKGARR